VKRISLSERDAAHAYEWLVMYWQDEGRGRFGGCLHCEMLGRRLEKFIGESEARRIRRLVAQHPTSRQLDVVATAGGKATTELLAPPRKIRRAHLHSP
jgi:hypothetical protein